MIDPYEAPGVDSRFVPPDRTPLAVPPDEAPFAWRIRLALHAACGLLATFAIAYCVWLLIVLNGLDGGLLR